MKIQYRILVATTIFLVYLAYSGNVSTFTLFTGVLASSSLLLYLRRYRLLEGSIDLRELVRAMNTLLKYLVVFTIVVLKEHIEVTKIIYSKRPAIKPGLVKIPLKLRNKKLVAFLALTITNTPGTIVVDVDWENWYIYVHCLDIKTEDIEELSKMITRRFESVLLEKNLVR